MGTFGERLHTAMALRNCSQPKLASAIGLKQQSIGPMFKTDGNKFVVQIARFLGVRVEWLALGEGPMEPPDGPNPHITETDTTIEREHFAMRLKATRISAGYYNDVRRAKFAKIAGIESSRYEAMEEARVEPDVNELVGISRAANVSMDHLLLGLVPRPGLMEPGKDPRPYTLHEPASPKYEGP